MKKFIISILFLSVIFLTGCINVNFGFNVTEITLYEGKLYQLEPIEDLEDIEYNIENEEIASVTYKGLIRAISEGETVLTAVYKNKVVSIVIIVEKEPLNNPVDPKEEIRDLNVYFIDVGQGDAIFMELPNGENMMIDAGYGTGYKDNAWNNITSVIDDLDIEVIDHFLITHNHQDHYYFVPDIINKYGIENIYGSGSVRTNVQYKNIMLSIENAGLEYLVLEVGDLIIDEDYLSIQVVATQQLANDTYPNISSVMVRLVYKDTAFMFTGDGGVYNSKDAEYIALESGLDLSADVLKVGHHGSRYSSSTPFLEAVNPTYAIMTTSENSGDGLPTQAAIDRIEAIGAIIYQTKDSGTITVMSDGSIITISTEN